MNRQLAEHMKGRFPGPRYLKPLVSRPRVPRGAQYEPSTAHRLQERRSCGPPRGALVRKACCLIWHGRTAGPLPIFRTRPSGVTHPALRKRTAAVGSAAGSPLHPHPRPAPPTPSMYTHLGCTSALAVHAPSLCIRIVCACTLFADSQLLCMHLVCATPLAVHAPCLYIRIGFTCTLFVNLHCLHMHLVCASALAVQARCLRLP